MKPTLKVLIGAPGSGKTTCALEYKDNPTVIHLSSDAIRFSKHDQGVVLSHNEVFETMYQELRKHAKDESVVEVIYDATNMSAKKRLHLYKTFHKSYSIHTIYFLEPIETLQSRLNKRNSQHLLDGHSHLIVPQEAIINLLRSFTPDTIDTMKKYDIKSRLVNTHKINLQEIHNKAYSISHNSPHHLESVGEHIHRANNQIDSSKHHAQFGTVVRMHDLGKVYTGNGYGNFYGHANVSSYLYLTYEARQKPRITPYTFSTADSIANHMNRSYPILGSMELRRQFDEIDNNARTS